MNTLNEFDKQRVKATIKESIPRPDKLELEAGAFRLMLERQLDQYKQYGTIEDGAVRAMLDITDAGREAVAQQQGSIALIAAYQRLQDVLVQELYATKDELSKVLSCFRVCFGEDYVSEMRDRFQRGDGENAIYDIVKFVETGATRKLRKNSNIVLDKRRQVV